MVRPKYRKPPRPSVDDLTLDYDFSPRHGWGTYPARMVRENGNVLVWEERQVGQQNTVVTHLPTETLGKLVQLTKEL